jgi:hypothetical protein
MVSSNLNAIASLSDADSVCNWLASEASLAGTYKAWLSTTTESAASRLSHATVPYVNRTGAVLAYGWGDLVDGTLANPIAFDEWGASNSCAYSEGIVTGTSAFGDSATVDVDGGMVSAAINFSCNPSLGECDVAFGDPAATTSDWSQVATYTFYSYNNAAFYCVEQ